MLTLRRVVAVVFVFFLGFGFGSPAPNKLKRAVGAVNPGSYIVVLKPGVDKPNVVESHRAFAKATNTDDVEIVYSDWDGTCDSLRKCGLRISCLPSCECI